jgi:hypothetical protein
MNLIIASANQTLRRLLILLAIYVIASIFALNSSVLVDPDYWWHLRTGQWILAHGTVPTTDPFSTWGAGKPWAAYSWLFEVVIYGLYQKIGLMSILIYKVIILLGILWSVLNLLQRLEVSFLRAIGLTTLTLLAITQNLTPRPWLLTILFFTLELHLLLHFRQTGNGRYLLWLLPLFALWANVHIQFIYGFVPLGLIVAEPIIEEFLRRPFSMRWIRTAMTFRWWWMIPACFAATLLTPYHIKLYRPVLEITQQTGVYDFVTELQSMNFRHLSHWIVLGLVLWAAHRLGAQSVRRAFPLLFLFVSVALSFRSTRDAWVAALAAVTILALVRPATAIVKAETLPGLGLFAIFLLACGLTILLAKRYDVSDVSLQSEVEKNYPVAASRVVEERGLSGPLYNHFNWGGYLIWRLPNLPVSMDGRTNVYGTERIRRALDTWVGKPGWATDPELNAAGVIIAEVSMPLCSLLRFDQRFELVYEDSVAAVFRKRPGT